MKNKGNIRKKLRENINNTELDDSDIPIHEKRVKEEPIKDIKRRKF